MRSFYKKGFSNIELLVVLGVIVFLAALIVPSFYKIRENQVIESAVQDILTSLDKAKTETLSSLNSSQYGVHFQSGQVVIFKGTSYSAGASTNEAISITAPASISAITLTGGATDVYFNRLSGAPNVTGTVTVSTTNYTKTITISATGIVSTS